MPECRALFWDSIRGGTKTWSALFYVSGKPRYKKLGRYPILSLAQARDAARKFLENPQKAVSETEAGTFQDVSDSFMKRYVEANGLRSKREIARTLNKYILPRWQDRKDLRHPAFGRDGAARPGGGRSRRKASRHGARGRSQDDELARLKA